MAHRCNTIDDGKKWNSEVNNNDDGKLAINKEQGNGLFDGRREKNSTNKNLFGLCYEAGGSERIGFIIPENDHFYFGEINGAGNRIDGKRIMLGALLNTKRPEVLDDEEWVATKT